MIVWYIIGAVVLIILIYFFVTYNKLIKLSNRIKEAFATMDVYLKKRWDLIPNLVDTVKGYAKHEKDTFKEVVKLRNSVYDDLSVDEKISTNNKINSDISKIMMLAEAYPELKANENFIELSKELSKVEDEIAKSRKYYNAVIRDYNNKVEMFPSNIVANILGYKTQKMFEAKREEKENVKVELGE